MKLTNVLLVAMAVSVPAMPGTVEARQNCTEEDREYARKLGYDAESAYEFGLVIQKHVRNRDLESLFSLVDGELKHGPRKRFVKGRTFGELFTENWRNQVLAHEPDCRPFGYPRFVLGSLNIWFHAGRNHGNIFAIYGAKEEKYPLTGTDSAWREAGRIVEPECFKREWLSSDNFEAFQETFRITDRNDFSRNTGRYFGREIDHLDAIDVGWGPVRLATFPPACQPDDLDLDASRSPTTVYEDDVGWRYCSKNYVRRPCLMHSYRLLAPVQLTACQSLAPHLAGRCESAYFVRIYEEIDGSMKYLISFHIYGLFALDDGRRAIVPLVNFDSENDGRNFLDDLAAGHRPLTPDMRNNR